MAGKNHQHSSGFASYLTALYLAVLLILRYFFPERSIDTTGPYALWETFFSINLTLVFILTATLAGWKLFKRFQYGTLTRLEILVFSSVTGCGLLFAGYFLLGVVGLLNWPAMAFLLLALAAWSGVGAGGWTLSDLDLMRTEAVKKWKRSETWQKGILLSFGGLGLLAALQTLTPPIDYDSLMYHLQGPRLFLKAGSLVFIPEIWQANGPMTIELLYSLGLSLGSTAFPGLLHTYFWCLFISGTFALAKRALSSQAAWLSLVIMLGIPNLALLASWAYADFSWALFELLAILALFLWTRENRNTWLVLAGLMSGLALGSKYLAFGSFFLLAAGISVYLWKMNRKQLLLSLLIYSLSTLLAGFPWYLKNLVYTGNPIYPFVFGGPGYDPARLSLQMEYLRSFGTGDRLGDLLSIPFNIYLKPQLFSSFVLEIPGLLFPLALFYPLWRKHQRLDGLALYTLCWCLIWSQGSQQTRFLLPVFPLLSIFTAGSLNSIPNSAFKRVLVSTVLSILVLVSFGLKIQFLSGQEPLKTFLGQESKEQYLERNLYSYPATRYINTQLGPDQRVLFILCGQSYYCKNDNCLPDSTQVDWLWLSASLPDPTSLSGELRKNGVNHILYSHGEVDWFLKYHDENMHYRLARDFLLEQFVPQCTEQVYSDLYMDIYKITCQ